MRKTFRIKETTVYEVDAESEPEAEALFEDRGPEVTSVMRPIRFVRVDDRDVVETRNERGLPVVVVGQ